MQKNSEIILEITGMTSEGNGVGHYDGVAVFVPLTCVGDIVLTRIVKVKKNFCYGKKMKLIKSSDYRTLADCDSFAMCGGCVYRHIDYNYEKQIKFEKVHNAMTRIGGINASIMPIIGADDTERYRNKAQYPINADGSVGFYAVHSHRIIPCESCLLQPKEFDDIAHVVTDWIRCEKVSVYNEDTKTGILRHLYLRKATETGEIMVVFVSNSKTVKGIEYVIYSLKQLLGDSLKTVVVNVNTKDTNVILGTENIVLYGDGYITDILCGVKVRISPMSFYQVNRDMAEKLYQKAALYANAENKNIVDLYCGAGTIGLSMAGTAKSVIGVEIEPKAVEDAIFNANANGITNTEFICNDAAAAAKELAQRGIKPDVVIVDPPRKGCDESLLNIIAYDFCPETLVYVSCDPATLARDCKILENCGYKVFEYTPVDLFPRTSHVETVALLSRQKVDEHIYFDVNVGDLPKTARTIAPIQR